MFQINQQYAKFSIKTNTAHYVVQRAMPPDIVEIRLCKDIGLLQRLMTSKVEMIIKRIDILHNKLA
jgi:hypothetical protein